MNVVTLRDVVLPDNTEKWHAIQGAEIESAEDPAIWLGMHARFSGVLFWSTKYLYVKRRQKYEYTPLERNRSTFSDKFKVGPLNLDLSN